MRWIISGSLSCLLCFLCRRHGSEVVIRWCQRFFFLAASRLSFAASPLNSVSPNEKKTSGTQGIAQCSTLIFLLTCPLGNFVSSFTCRVYFFGCAKKSPPCFAHCFIEFSILVPSNFMPSINPKREVIRSHCLLTVKSLHKISTLFHCNQHSHALMMFTIDGLLLGAS